MTPLEMIKAGIVNDDFELICNAYYKLTGEKIAKAKKKFDPAKANKKQLYDEIKKHNSKLPAIAEYTVSDLREMYKIYSDTPSVYDIDNIDTYINDEEKKADKTVKNSGTFVFKKDRLLVGDKKNIVDKLKVTPRDLTSIKEAEFVEKEYRPPQEKIQIQCDLCKRSAEVLPIFVTSERAGFCDNCRESKPK